MLTKHLPKPSKLASFNDPKTDAEWEEYFAYRKKYDMPMSEEEQLALATKLLDIDPKNPEFGILARKLPMDPASAMSYKKLFGLKAVSDVNLYDAKLAFPDEF
ncbi:MAG: hypothetical protein IAB19_08700 [Proteobacteria bacterium]|uniref:Uncharacterized protein n=1 Tax=Candidatus Avisuccinivibrio stercorigallinarum TaxID=2840704 RepID=A0A9D9DD87_9GAMM|nr:hypothetical protein [Candidatus Avisuccinivibrio stercorigallinarum]